MNFAYGTADEKETLQQAKRLSDSLDQGLVLYQWQGQWWVCDPYTAQQLDAALKQHIITPKMDERKKL